MQKSETGCWLWTGLVGTNGYGATHVRGRDGVTVLMAHRMSYEFYVGPIPEGLVIDHLCRNTRCVRPDHLEPVTNQENVRRGYAVKTAARTHFDCGHPVAEAYVYHYKNNNRVTRRCRICAASKLRGRRRKTAA